MTMFSFNLVSLKLYYVQILILKYSCNVNTTLWRISCGENQALQKRVERGVALALMAAHQPCLYIDNQEFKHPHIVRTNTGVAKYRINTS